jgi:hypothetical protein
MHAKFAPGRIPLLGHSVYTKQRTRPEVIDWLRSLSRYLAETFGAV